jgi:hypothetical protein
MILNELDQTPGIMKDVKLKETYFQFQKLLSELRKRDLPEGLVMSINQDIEALNASADDWKKQARKVQTRIIKLLEKEMKLVPKDYYRSLWMTLGMSAFGIPMGVVFGISMGSMAYLGIGLPIGLVIGIAVGTAMDKKALEEGRQLDVEIKY